MKPRNVFNWLVDNLDRCFDTASLQEVEKITRKVDDYLIVRSRQEKKQ